MELKEFILVLAVVAAASAPTVGSIPNQDRGPAFSSPPVTMHENGDRISNYPPYYRPEPSRGGTDHGGRHR